MPKRQTQRSRNPAEYPVLGMLASGPAHGYDICRNLQSELGAVWTLGRSQVYALLARLERDGLVVHERVGQENLPAKNIFSITRDGHAVFRHWAGTPVVHVRNMRLEFLTKLWFAQKRDAESEKSLIAEQLKVCREKERRLATLSSRCTTQTECRSMDFRRTMIEAAISWLENLLK
ncbi:MAG TPA: PadR family transcriptional regulator [Desulfomonilaceae bacterium]|nr:PadR family transcriptional regulator [Desulfomonilaceae bacterium]